MSVENPDWDDDSDNPQHKIPPMDWASIGEIKVIRVPYSEWKPSDQSPDYIKTVIPAR